MDAFFHIIRRSLFGIIVLLILMGIAGVLYLESTLPSVALLKEMRLAVPLKIYSSDGKLISEFGEERRKPITLDQVPPNLINAILATEDRRFYEHPGVDFRGLLRAGVTLLTHSSIKQGGSTITMQVARNFFLTRQKTFIRKLSEILLALKIEKGLTKDEILELYLNKIYFGKRAYGIAAAAAVYYDTTVEKLTLPEAAMLAGLPQAPSSINPLNDPDAAFKRRKHVLERMLSYEFITPEQFKEAVEAPLPTKSFVNASETQAPYVAEMVRQDLYARYGDAIYTLGYEVYTTINSEQQMAANAALRKTLLAYDQRHGYRKTKLHLNLSRSQNPEEMIDSITHELREVPAYGNLLPGVVTRIQNQQISVLLQDGRYIEIPWSGLSWARPQLKGARVGSAPQKPSDVVSTGDIIYTEENNKQWKMVQIPDVGGAIVSLDPKTGAILALVGGFDYGLSNFNRVTQALRQPGSNFKPFLYAAALANGYTLSTKVNDAPLVFTDAAGNVWRPHNATNKFYGPTSLRRSLARSQNMVSIRLLQAVGIKKFLEFGKNFGFNTDKFPPYLPLALGSAELTPLEVATGYCVFANGGNLVSPYLITKIKDYQGNLVYEAPPPTSIVTIGPEVAYLMTVAMQDAIQRGTGYRAKSLNRMDLAGKTGTTNDWFDAWYSGYNQDLVVTTWIGFDEPRTLGYNEFGGVAALPMWISFMETVLKDKPEHPVEPPPGIVSVKVDADTGLLATEDNPNTEVEVFMENTLPTQTAGSLGMEDGGEGSAGNGGGASLEALF